MSKIAVHLHIFYYNQVDYFLKKLQSLSDYNYDLFVTLPDENTEVIRKIKAFKSNTKIWAVGNRGYDVGPFIDFLNKINLDNYDFILKLHTKGTSWSQCTKLNKRYISNYDWAHLMINALLESKETIAHNLDLFKKNQNIAMVGSQSCLTSEKQCFQGLINEINGILTKLNLPNITSCTFIAGTMFMARSAIFKPLQEKYLISDFASTNGRVKDGTLAHVFERVFGILASQGNNQIQGIGNENWIKYKSILNATLRFFYQNKKTDKKHIIKIFKISVYRKKLIYEK